MISSQSQQNGQKKMKKPWRKCFWTLYKDFLEKGFLLDFLCNFFKKFNDTQNTNEKSRDGALGLRKVTLLISEKFAIHCYFCIWFTNNCYTKV